MAQCSGFVNPNHGPIESTSIAVAALPNRALNFIDTYYPGIDVSTMTESYIPKTYQVTMNNGTVIDFDAQGYMMKVVAPEGQTLPVALLQGEMSRRAFEELACFDGVSAATSLESTPRGPKVSFENKSLADLDLVYALF